MRSCPNRVRAHGFQKALHLSEPYPGEAFGGELAALEPRLSAVELPERHDCEEPHKAIRYIYFPEAGIASVVAKGNGQLVEVGMIGREGMTGLMVVMGNDRSPHHTYMQVAGEGSSHCRERVFARS